MMVINLYEQLIDKKTKIAIVGLGYVGLPLLAALDKHFSTIGFDISQQKIESLKNKQDKEDILSKQELQNLNSYLTFQEKDIRKASFIIIAVPTPINSHNNPDLSLVKSATQKVARNLNPGAVIVYESTVYPGVTEEICIPIIETESGLVNQKDFFVGYSPERINPGDRVHTLDAIVKVVSAQDPQSLDVIDKIYSKVTKAGTYRAPSIKVAEAAKVIENTQRDLNIALINELAILFNKLEIDSNEVLKAAKTKWNFLDFSPGLVGGHCIGVDPYYLTYKAKEVNYHPEVILAGRKINDNMSHFIGDQILRNILNHNQIVGKIKVILFGITFKENIADIRNSKVVDIFRFLKDYNMDVKIYDPLAEKSEVKKHYDIDLIDYEQISESDALVFCVAHDNFKKIDLSDLKKKMGNKSTIIFDIKWIFEPKKVEKSGFRYWRL